MVERSAEEKIAERIALLSDLSAVLSDPHRLVDVLLGVDDPATAVDVLVAELGVSRLGATGLLDVQFRRLIGRNRALIDAELAEWREKAQ